MKAEDLTANEAIDECLAIVDRSVAATATGRYADGYRAAATDIRAGIEARFGGRTVAPWERELRDMEIEARTMSRVLGLLRREQLRSSSAIVRRALTDLINAIDDGDAESNVQLTLTDVG